MPVWHQVAHATTILNGIIFLCRQDEGYKAAFPRHTWKIQQIWEVLDKWAVVLFIISEAYNVQL